ncbi:MAG: dUTP diphosphatase [Myxococcota bacterium]|nr:dUTP diphosphatase [Myxococcota bacterium]
MIRQLEHMLELQNSINQKVHPHWEDQGFEWFRAVWIEAAEMMDHWGWKWWKKQDPQLAQVHLELIDIWHFGLSLLIQENGISKTTVERVETELRQSADSMPFLEAVENFARLTLETKSFPLQSFVTLMEASKLSFDDLYCGYVGKNVLNFFRQDHGYKTGTYQKLWNGREDNEHLAEIIAALDVNALDFQTLLYQELKNRYSA